jgi:putative transposase
MSEAYKARDDSKAYFITFTIVHWIELFSNEDFARIIIDSIRFCQQNKGLELYAYCIMPSHVHLIGRSKDRKINEVIRDIKKFTSVQIIKLIKESNVFVKYLPVFYCESARRKRNEKYKVWQDGYHPIEMFSKRIFVQKLNYIHNNPVEAGIVNKPVEYKFSSAQNYAGLEGVLDVICEY